MNSENFDLDALNKEVDEINDRMKARESQGLLDVYKYFDRINDKLSSYNNMLIAGYFAIVTFYPQTSKTLLVIPLINMAILIYVDYIMMEQGRFLSQITLQPISKVEKYSRNQDRATLLSLLTISTTLIVTIILIYLINNMVIKK